MEIKAYSFEQNSLSYADVKRSVTEQLTEQGVVFESHSDPKELFEAINSTLDVADVILLGVESKVFLKFKPVLIKAFDFTPAYSDKISSAIGELISDEKLKKAHCLVPDESTELVAEDGLYSGFYTFEDNQYIVVFPLLQRVLPEMLMVEDLPFFKIKEDKSVVFEAIMDGDVASTKAEAIVEKLRENNFTLAIPTTPASKLLKADIKACENFLDYVFFTPFVNDAGIEDPKQYSAQLAKGAMDLRSATIGATISNIFREKKGDKILSYYAFVSVATEDKIVVKKLFADPDEKIDNLVIEATSELYSMIDKYLDEIIFKTTATPEELQAYENSLVSSEVVSDVRPEASISKTGAIASIIAIIVAIVICIIVGFKLGGQFVTPSDRVEEDSLQEGENITTTAPTTTIPSTIAYADLTDIVSDTDIFNVTTTIPLASNVIIYPQRPYEPETEDKTTTEKATAEKTTDEKTTAEKTTTEKTTVGKTTTEKATTVKATTEKATTEKATTVKATTEKATTEKATTVKATTVKATTEKTTTEKATTEKTTAEKTTAEKTTAEKTTVSKKPTTTLPLPETEEKTTEEIFELN